MRAMLVANLDVSNRFANGARGRVACWHPEIEQPCVEDTVDANEENLCVRFDHEDSIQDD